MSQPIRGDLGSFKELCQYSLLLSRSGWGGDIFQIEEHFVQSPAYLDCYACKLNFRSEIILKCSLFALCNAFLLKMFNVLNKFCEEK